MPLAEKMREVLPVKDKFHMLSAIARQGVEFVKHRIEKHGIFGEILVWMIVFSGLRLMWSHEFPLAWWIIMGMLIVYESLKDKFVWPAERYRQELEDRRLTDEKAKQQSSQNLI